MDILLILKSIRILGKKGDLMTSNLSKVIGIAIAILFLLMILGVIFFHLGTAKDSLIGSFKIGSGR